MSKVEKGVMVMKDGKAWGIAYEDGQSTAYGWVDVESATIYNPEFFTKTTDATYKGSHLIPELEKGELVHVERATTVKVIGA
ncbi:MAG: hypothetical protein OEL79_04705 [Chromatiales bacterium]|nr:hypothetical protein [Chromatiales bacterium]